MLRWQWFVFLPGRRGSSTTYRNVRAANGRGEGETPGRSAWPPLALFPEKT